VKKLGIEASHAKEDHGAEGPVIAKAGQDLAAGPAGVGDPFGHERPLNSRAGGMNRRGSEHGGHRLSDSRCVVGADRDPSNVALVKNVGRNHLDHGPGRAEMCAKFLIHLLG
jgi:hypothetical protein